MSVTESSSPFSPGATEPPAQLMLASASPRRQELLRQIGVRFHVRAPEIDEQRHAGEMPQAYVCRLAQEKAAAGLELARPYGLTVLGADTIVVCDGQILGKPADQEQALAMLALLSGREHSVLTAVCVCDDKRSELLVSPSRVRFRTLHTNEKLAYWASGEPQGKAGAYAIQGLGAMFVEHLEGSYSGVMGLPLYETSLLLAEFDIATGLQRPIGAPPTDMGTRS